MTGCMPHFADDDAGYLGRTSARSGSTAGWLEMKQDLACVIELPGFAGILGRALLVQADEQVEFAPDGPDASRSGSSESHWAYQEAQSSSAPSTIRKRDGESRPPQATDH